MLNLRSIFLSSLLAISLASSAQKLPNIQLAGLRAPAKVKADGKLSEWGDLQAYNKATQVFYTIANDDNNLYLTVQAKDQTVIKKIIAGGVSLTVNSLGEKNFKNSVIITYPHYNNENKTFRVLMVEQQEVAKDIIKNSLKADSLMMVLNKQLGVRMKMISVEGSTLLKDNVISVYNEDGIKSVGLFDNQINYNCELAISLKYLNLKNNLNKFSYNIKLNGAAPKNATVTLSGSGNFLLIGDGLMATAPTPENYTLYSPTDFWGEYELVK